MTSTILRAALAVAAFAAVAASAQGYRYNPADDEGDEYRGRSQELRDAYRRGYERGYDRGYRRGQESAERRAPPPPAVITPPPNVPTGPIQITGAYYGTSENNCQAGRQVARVANGKRSYSFKVTNEICGDPSPGNRKSLEVTYTCGHLQKAASAREHQVIYLDCSS
jgi:hypothetical protein